MDNLKNKQKAPSKPSIQLLWRAEKTESGFKVIPKAMATGFDGNVVFEIKEIGEQSQPITLNQQRTAEWASAPLIDLEKKGASVSVWSEVNPLIRAEEFASFKTFTEEEPYPDKIRFEALGNNGKYFFNISIADQKGKPISKAKFMIANPETGELLKSDGTLSEEESGAIFETDKDGTILPRLKIEFTKKTIKLRIVPVNFQLVNLPDGELPLVVLSGPQEKEKEWYLDENFYAYVFWSITLLFIIATILLKCHSFKMWEFNFLLLMISFFSVPFVFQDDLRNVLEEAARKWKEKKSFYSDLPDRPKEGAERVVEVATNSFLQSFGGFVKWIGDEIIGGLIIHRLLGMRKR